MRTGCPQCGATLTVMESDFFLRCPYCESRIVVSPPDDAPYIVMPAVDATGAERRFPPGTVTGTELRWFPYLERAPGELTPCFSQPWPELSSYRPPAGDRKLWDEEMAEPEQLIPFDREMEDAAEGSVVFHPFHVVMLGLEGFSEGFLVDAVSGSPVGGSPFRGEEEEGEGTMRLFLRSLLFSLMAAVPVYLLLRVAGVSWLARTMAAVLAAGGLELLRRRLRGGSS